MFELRLSSFFVILWLLSTISHGVYCQNTSTIDSNEMGIGVLYDMVNVFLGDVVHKERIMVSFLNLSALIKHDNMQHDVLSHWKGWLMYLIGFAVCFAIGVVFFVVMPIVGFIFCCCRCCNRCGGKKKLEESKRAKCKRRSYCTVLLVLNTLALAGVVCAFLCTSLLYKSLQNEDDNGAIGHIISGLRSFENYADNSVQDASSFILSNVDKVSTHVLEQVKSSADDAVENILKSINATVYIDQAKEISRDANRTKVNLDKVALMLEELRNESLDLQANLTRIKIDVESVCPSPSTNCVDFEPSQYKMDADFSSLDTLSQEASNVSDSLNMNQYITQAEGEIEKAKENASDVVRKQIDVASKSILTINETITDGIDKLKENKNDALSFLSDAYNVLGDADDDAKKFSKYIYYVGIGVGCAYLLIVGLYYVGILFGMCGEKPGAGAQCCNTGSGSRFLMAGVFFTFILSSLLMLLCSILFITGGPLYTEACRYFIDHNPSEFKAFDRTLRNDVDYFKHFSKSFSVADSIRRCQNNDALFSAFELDNVVDLDDIMKIEDLTKKLDSLKNATINLDNITIITPGLKTDLNKLADSGLGSVNFTDYFTELGKQLIVGNLTHLAILVDGYALFQNDTVNKESLNRSADSLRFLDTTTIPRIRNKVQKLEETLKDLQASSTIKKSIQKLITDMETAQARFNSEKDDLVKEEIAKLTDGIEEYVNETLDRIKEQIRGELFGCQPLSSALYTVTDAVCVLSLNPYNGLWFSYGWCLFFFVPCLIFAVLLSNQYRREQEYVKEFEDPNYSMYGGPNHDTIPLTSLEQPPNYRNPAPPYYGYPKDPNSRGLANSGYEHDQLPGAWTGEKSKHLAKRPHSIKSNKVQPIDG